jgi:hypothetical protein
MTQLFDRASAVAVTLGEGTEKRTQGSDAEIVDIPGLDRAMAARRLGEPHAVDGVVVRRKDERTRQAACARFELGGIGAAIANAFFDATGVRIREAPMTPGRIRPTLKAAGVA